MRDLDLTDRDARLAYTTRVVGRELASSNELRFGEAIRLIEELKAIAELPADQRARLLAGDQEAEVIAALQGELDAETAGGDVTPRVPSEGEVDQVTAPQASDARDEPLSPPGPVNPPDPLGEFPEGF
jgi:hypothetical protein